MNEDYRTSRLEEVTEQDVVKHLAGSRRGQSVREIAGALDLRHRARRQLQKVLAQLERKGEVEQSRQGRFSLVGERKSAPAHRKGNAAGSVARQTYGGPAENQRAAAKSASVRDPNLFSGRIVIHRDGYGFVVPDSPIPGVDGDLYVSAANVGDAMHGDQVVARIERRRPDGRAEGRVVQVARHAHPTIVGVFRYGSRENTVIPFETRLRQEIVIPLGEELTPELREKYQMTVKPDRPSRRPRGTASAAGLRSLRRGDRLPELDGAVVNVELTRFPRSGAAPTGRVVEILGRRSDFGVDVEIMIRKHHLPHVFPEEVLAEARAVPQEVTGDRREGREDFRHLPVVTIDGETARDFDDAVYVARLPGDRYELQVHIADVGHYVRPGSPLDREARLRGTSVYFPDRAVPMLPAELSNGICSLNPRVDRLVMSAVMEVDASGNVLNARFTPGVIRSAERMTYTAVNQVLKGDPEATAKYSHLAENFCLMEELALRMNARRERRGSIDFDLPEPVIEFDEMGRMVTVVRSERNIANRIIEEFMLAANEAVARYLESRAVPSLHRVHEKPDPKRVLEFEELAHSFGYSLGIADLAERRLVVKHGEQTALRGRRGRTRPMSVLLPAGSEIDIRPQHYQRLTQKIAGKPEERILSYLMLRSLKQARYAAEPLGHFALATDFYTHFTSPIRRYPDLIVHRVLKWTLEHPSAARPATHRGESTAMQPALGPYRQVELEEIATESSEAERRAANAERELMDWKTAQFMEQHLGDVYEALIISVLKFGFFVELMDIFVEGLVPIERLEELLGGRCFYRERDHAIVADRLVSGNRAAPQRSLFRLGDRLRVRAERIDPMFMRVEFAPAE